MLKKCPKSKLLLSEEFIEEKNSLKKSIESVVERAVNDLNHVDENYFLEIHAKFDPQNPKLFQVDAPRAHYKLPTFTSNQLVFWVSPRQGICELLWMVAPKKPGEKLHVEFNTEGVAYLQAKGAMAS